MNTPSEQLYQSFLGTMLWASIDDEGEPLDDNFNLDDIDQISATMIKTLCDEFIAKAGDTALLEKGYQMAGHDFYLTIAGHGAGFWDGDWPINGDTLTALCEEWVNDIYTYVNDGLVYVEVAIIGK